MWGPRDLDYITRAMLTSKVNCNRVHQSVFVVVVVFFGCLFVTKEKASLGYFKLFIDIPTFSKGHITHSPDPNTL